METTQKTIMDRLKEETREQHAAAEGMELERALAKGTLPKDVYVRYLEQRLVLHVAFEKHLREAADSHPAFARVITEYQYQEPYLLEDMAFFGRDVNGIVATPSTVRLIGQIDETARTCPVALLGYQYVFEGSNNGAKFLAKVLRGVYRLEGTNGTKYLDPYGDEQRQRWQDWRAAMNDCAFSDEEQEAILEAARHCFTGIMNVDGDLYPAS
jgi:heme oxygenase